MLVAMLWQNLSHPLIVKLTTVLSVLKLPIIISIFKHFYKCCLLSNLFNFQMLLISEQLIRSVLIKQFIGSVAKLVA